MAGDRGEHLAVLGMSTSQTCGVRDHATLLAGALQQEGVRCTLHWLGRSELTLRGGRAEVSAWTRTLAGELREDPPDALLLHYSVFSHSHRGLPLFVPQMIGALQRSGAPLIGLLHEFAFHPWRPEGAQGAAWALSQRAVLVAVMRACSAVIVTTPERGEWLASRGWLARRELAFAPVFSTLPAPTGVEREGEGPQLGLFGYSYGALTASLVLDAVARLRERGLPVVLTLLGAPGPDSETAGMWAQAARSRGLAEALRFSGTLPEQELSNTLAGCDVLLFADDPGPTARKTTLAGSLASGTAVVATDGPESWKELLAARAIELVQPRGDALADGVERLLNEPVLREALGERGRAFAVHQMGVGRSAGVVRGLLEEIRARQARVGSTAVSESASVGRRPERLDSHSARARP